MVLSRIRSSTGNMLWSIHICGIFWCWPRRQPASASLYYWRIPSVCPLPPKTISRVFWWWMARTLWFLRGFRLFPWLWSWRCTGSGHGFLRWRWWRFRLRRCHQSFSGRFLGLSSNIFNMGFDTLDLMEYFLFLLCTHTFQLYFVGCYSFSVLRNYPFWCFTLRSFGWWWWRFLAFGG